MPNQVCTICTQKCNFLDHVLRYCYKTKCKHIFHKICLLSWVKQGNKLLLRKLSISYNNMIVQLNNNCNLPHHKNGIITYCSFECPNCREKCTLKIRYDKDDKFKPYIKHP